MSEKLIFSKKFRLLKKRQFQQVRAQQAPLIGKYYKLCCQPNGLTYPRLGIIAAKKKCHLAVLRNQIKRQARESFRQNRPKLPAYDIVAIARQSAQEASPHELRQCLDKLFLKLIEPCNS